MILARASVGYEGEDAPEMPLVALFSDWEKGQCTFLRKNRCEIHNSGFKPLQCRESLACDPDKATGYLDNYEMARLWKTMEAKAIVKKWKEAISNPQN